MSRLPARHTPLISNFTFVGYRFDSRRSRATFYYRDNQGHHYAEKIDFDCLDFAQVDQRLLARALDFALFALGLAYYELCPAVRVSAKKPVSARLAHILTAINPAATLPVSDARPPLPYQGSGNLILMDSDDDSYRVAAELTAARLPFRPLYISEGSHHPQELDKIGKPLTIIYRRTAAELTTEPVLVPIALAIVQAVLYNFNHIYLSHSTPIDRPLADFIQHEISPDLELIWKN